MRLHKVVDGYLTYKKSLGMRFKNEGFALRAFCRAMGDIELGHADPAAVLAFIGDSRMPGRWRCYYRIFKSFYRYALERGFVRTSPLSGRPPNFPAQTPPYIYSTDELKRLFAAASALPTVYSPLQPLTYRTLLMLLYGAGLRVGEAGHSGACVELSDLVTNQRRVSICESGYTGSVGELWFSRVLPPALPASSDHVVFTSPYVLIAPDANGWTQYFDRIAAKDSHWPRIEALERHLKWGASRRYWSEFAFEGYVNHQPGAIFLKGLPDVPESRPHSREYVRDADGH
jgi:hypothetical protein